jgi:hypothetical protein
MKSRRVADCSVWTDRRAVRFCWGIVCASDIEHVSLCNFLLRLATQGCLSCLGTTWKIRRPLDEQA